MVGSFSVRVKNSRNTYEFVIKRNITVLCGDSGTGKTTLYDMIRDYNRLGKSSGVSVSCDRQIVALEGERWEEELHKLKGSIVVVDEDSRFIRTKEFAKAIGHSDNYYLLITREYLQELPYSVDEIYKVTGRKNKRFDHLYTQRKGLYVGSEIHAIPFRPKQIITEDSGSGFQFFQGIVEGRSIECISAGGKSNVYNVLKQFEGPETVVIADGAAFGCEMHALADFQKFSASRIAIYLPESFEWLILNARVVKGVKAKMLLKPEEHADSKKYVSWERFFTDVLTDLTRDVPAQKYSKKRLKPYYKQGKAAKRIRDSITGIEL